MAKKLTAREARAMAIQAHNQVRDDFVTAPFTGHPLGNGVYEAKEILAQFPYDPRTGLPMTDLGRLSDPKLTMVEKEQVMARLGNDKGVYMPSELSDEEMLSIIPSRYFMDDDVDIQMWRDYLSREILPEMGRSAQHLAEAGKDLVPDTPAVEDEE